MGRLASEWARTKDDLLPRPTGSHGASALGQKMALLVEALIFYSVAFGLIVGGLRVNSH